MIPRSLRPSVEEHLRIFPAVALLGPRQVGKTTMARAIADAGLEPASGAGKPGLYLDLENPGHRERLVDARGYLGSVRDRLVVLDEIHRVPELFQELRGIIDERIRDGEPAGHFLVLGSASMDLMRQSGESLAGRIGYLALDPLDVREVGGGELTRLWIRGGFPRSFLAPTDEASTLWRENFIRTYLERDIPMLGPRIPAETLRRFWTMLAHSQGGLWNAAALARSLSVDGKTVVRYLDLLADLLLVRRLSPFHANVRKRLVKSPKVYVRDSGIVHTLLGLDDRHAVDGSPGSGNELGGLRDRDPHSGGSGAHPRQLLPDRDRHRNRSRPGVARRPGLGDRGQARARGRPRPAPSHRPGGRQAGRGVSRVRRRGALPGEGRHRGHRTARNGGGTLP